MRHFLRLEFYYYCIALIVIASMSIYTVYIMVSIVNEYDKYNILPIVPNYSHLFIPIVSLISFVYFFRDRDYLSIAFVAFTFYVVPIALFFFLYNGQKLAQILSSLNALSLPLFTYMFTLWIVSHIRKLYFFNVIIVIAFIYVLIQYFIISNILFTVYNYNININISYIPLLLLFIILAINNKYVSGVSIILVCIALLVSGKRGGTIAFFFAIFLTILLWFSNNNKRKAILLLIFIGGVIFYLLYFTDFLSANRTLERFFDNNGDMDSGRSNIYMNVFTMFLKSDFFNMLLGHGFGTVELHSKSGLSAHDDFLEVLYDFGVVGLILYCRFHYCFFIKVLHFYKLRSYYAYPMIFAYACFFILSIVSHMFGYPYFYLLAFFLGYIRGMEKRIYIYGFI